MATERGTTLASGALNDPTAPRVRFAPSPTGSLHVGGARTALYNLLFARHTGGTFVLRIEDTDVERSREELTAQILSAMEWLGLEYDEGPLLQSQRGALYQAAIEKLLAEGKAYRAFEPPEELDAERKKAEAAGKAYRYSGAGRAISPEESARRASAGERHVVRLRMPDTPIVVDDMVRGRIEFPPEALDDFVLVRSGGHPLYHFCVCVDDIENVADLSAAATRPSATGPRPSRSGATRGSFPRRSSTSSPCSDGRRAATARSSRAKRWSASSRSRRSAPRRRSSTRRSCSG